MEGNESFKRDINCDSENSLKQNLDFAVVAADFVLF